MSSSRIIVHADDLGYASGRDEAAFSLFRSGHLTSASLLVSGATAAAAAQRAMALGLPLGLHLNLTEGPCLCAAMLGTRLVDARGRFLGKHGLRQALEDCEDSSSLHAAIRAEVQAQVAEFRDLCRIMPAHVDGHQHVHVHPVLAPIIASALAVAGIYRVRMPCEPLVMDWVLPSSRAEFHVQVAAQARRAREVYVKSGFAMPDAFVGLNLMGLDSSVERILQSVLLTPSFAGSVVEFMAHPGLQRPASSASAAAHAAEEGFAGTAVDGFHASPEREHELQVLRDPRLWMELEEAGFRLADFSALARGGRGRPSHKGCVAIVSPATLGTGNYVTACRVRRALIEEGWSVVLVDALGLSRARLRQLLADLRVSGVFAIHAYRSGRLVLGAGVPYAVILGGTDVNQNPGVPPAQQEVIQQVLAGARLVVAFNAQLAGRVQTATPVRLVPQAVSVPRGLGLRPPRNGRDAPDSFAWPERPYFLLPTGIRAVKDPLFLLRDMQRMVPRADLIVSGPMLDPSLEQPLRASCAANVVYVGALPRGVLLAGMARAVGVVNCSISEGVRLCAREGRQTADAAALGAGAGGADVQLDSGSDGDRDSGAGARERGQRRAGSARRDWNAVQVQSRVLRAGQHVAGPPR
jgi:predicted glycoside hydrolase/deacetylase ChbG (UPF0249 family)